MALGFHIRFIEWVGPPNKGMKTDRLLRQVAVYLKSGYCPAAYPQCSAKALTG